MGIYYKSIPFEQALTQQLVRVMQEVSNGSPNAINAVKALEATVIGYIDDDLRYAGVSSELTARYEQRVTLLRKRREENELSSVGFQEEKRPLDIELAINLFAEISRAMVKCGIHPARTSRPEEWKDVQEEDTNAAPSSTEPNKE